jgi:hypothetical protein
MIQHDSAIRQSDVASGVARLPARTAPSATANKATAYTPTCSLNSRRVVMYSSAVVISMATRLTALAAASPPMSSASAASTGYSAGRPGTADA